MRRIGLALALLVLLTATHGEVQGARWPDNPTASAVWWVKGSGEYEMCCRQAYRLAEMRLLEALKTVKGPWAVVLDVDETVLSNAPYQVELAETGREYRRESWDRWCERRAAEPIAGVREFLALVKEKGGKVALVTNRRENLRAATTENLKRVKLPFDALLMRAVGKRVPRDKSPRRAAVASGAAFGSDRPHQVLLFMGDQLGDLFEGGKKALADHRLEIGTRFVLFPNPMYGAWTWEND